jgi:ankyrin repeat protein
VRALQVDCVLYLVAASAALDVRDRHGRTAMQIASTNPHSHCARCTLSRSSSMLVRL